MAEYFVLATVVFVASHTYGLMALIVARRLLILFIFYIIKILRRIGNNSEWEIGTVSIVVSHTYKFKLLSFNVFYIYLRFILLVSFIISYARQCAITFNFIYYSITW